MSACPVWLTPSAEAYWRKVAPTLAGPAGDVPPEKVALLAAYCQASARLAHAAAMVADLGMIVDGKPHLALAIEDQATRRLATLSRLLWPGGDQGPTPPEDDIPPEAMGMRLDLMLAAADEWSRPYKWAGGSCRVTIDNPRGRKVLVKVDAPTKEGAHVFTPTNGSYWSFEAGALISVALAEEGPGVCRVVIEAA